MWAEIHNQDSLHGCEADGKNYPSLPPNHSFSWLVFMIHQITRVQTIHEKNLIYRDIKPDNFLIGRPGTKGSNGKF